MIVIVHFKFKDNDIHRAARCAGVGVLMSPTHLLRAWGHGRCVKPCTMERSLKRVLDYKLVFECLADGSNGLIPLHTLTARWPTQQEAEGMLISMWLNSN